MWPIKNISCAIFLTIVFICWFSISPAQAHIVGFETHFYSNSGGTSLQIQFHVSTECKDSVTTIEGLGYFHSFADGRESTRELAKRNQGLKKSLSKIKIARPDCYDQAIEMVAYIAAMHASAGLSAEELHFRLNILTSLQHLHLVGVLTESVRKELELNDPEFKGVFSCQKKKIWLDDTLEPYNLGLVLLHELSHLARAMVNRESLKKNSMLNPEEYFLLDETLSSLHMAYTSTSLRNNPNRKSDEQNPSSVPSQVFRSVSAPIRFFFMSSRYRRPLKYQASTDADVTTPKGLFYDAWKTEVADYGVGLNWGFDDFIQNAFNNKPSWDIVLQKINEIYVPQSPGLYSRIHQTILNIKNVEPQFIDPLKGIYKLSPDQLKTAIDNLSCGEESNSNPAGGEGSGLGNLRLRLHNYKLRACHLKLKGL